MALSEADRAALHARAAGLREEVSSLKTASAGATREASDAIDDAKLLEELERLEAEKAIALAQRDSAEGTVADAQAAMEAAAEKFDRAKTESDLAQLDVAPVIIPIDSAPLESTELPIATEESPNVASDAVPEVVPTALADNDLLIPGEEA